jgi:hypothetical protein
MTDTHTHDPYGHENMKQQIREYEEYAASLNDTRTDAELVSMAGNPRIAGWERQQALTELSRRLQEARDEIERWKNTRHGCEISHGELTTERKVSEWLAQDIRSVDGEFSRSVDGSDIRSIDEILTAARTAVKGEADE